MLFLGHNNQEGSPGIKSAQADVYGTHALLLTRHGAVKLLEYYHATPGAKSLPVDVWMSRVPGLRRYCVLPSMVSPFDMHDSETSKDAWHPK